MSPTAEVSQGLTLLTTEVSTYDIRVSIGEFCEMYWHTNERSNPYVYVMILTKTNLDEIVDRVIRKRRQFASTRVTGNGFIIIAPST